MDFDGTRSVTVAIP